MGAEYNYVKSESRTDYTPADKGTSTHSITKENHAAVFAEYSIDFKPFSLRVGLRYEHVDSRLDYLKDETGRTGIGSGSEESKLEQLELERQKQPPPSRFIANTITSTHPSCSLIRRADSPSR